MIDLTKSKDAGRVIKNAVLDDVTPAKRGDEFTYWRGETDTDPRGQRKTVFDAIRELSGKGLIELYQRRVGGDEFDYVARVR